MAHKFELKNPLLEREKYKNINKDGLEESKVELEKVIQKTIATYGQIKHLTTTLLETIDFDDKEFINRIYENESELFDTDLIELKESIKEIGIINMVYLLEKENGKKVIISGLRRLLASRELLRVRVKVKVLVSSFCVILSVLNSYFSWSILQITVILKNSIIRLNKSYESFQKN